MINLSSAMTVRVVTDAAVALDVIASATDRDDTTGAITPVPAQLTAISTATTTTVLSAPSSGSKRRIQMLSVCNTSSSASVTATVQVFDGSTPFQLDKRVLGPGQSFVLREDGTFDAPASGGQIDRPWMTSVIGLAGNCDPGQLVRDCQRAGNVGATPTNIGTSVARCALFVPPRDITINRIRAFGVGSTTSLYRVAIYRLSGLARLTAELPFSTAVDTWVSIGSALGLTLSKDVPYFVACAVSATSTTAGILCKGGTIAATTGRINTAPGSLPGSLATSGGYLDCFEFQFAVSSGALPSTAATLAAQAAWTGGMPAFWGDTADT